MKRTIITTLLATIAISASVNAYSAPIARHEFYDTNNGLIINVVVDDIQTVGAIDCDTLMVTAVDKSTDEYIIEAVAQNGNVFTWLDCDGDWFVGDLASVIFDTMNTAEIEDDAIIYARYSGWVDDISGWIK